MEQHEYDEWLRRLSAASERHEARMTELQRLHAKLDARQDDLAERQQVHEDIMKSLAATLVKQDTINDNQQRINERLSTSIERLAGILVGIRDILRRGNGRTEG